MIKAGTSIFPVIPMGRNRELPVSSFAQDRPFMDVSSLWQKRVALPQQWTSKFAWMGARKSNATTSP
jgi:hypothetical protein